MTRVTTPHRAPEFLTHELAHVDQQGCTQGRFLGILWIGRRLSQRDGAIVGHRSGCLICGPSPGATVCASEALPGAPDGEYVVIQYESSFEHKQSAIETVTPMLDTDGKWRVSGYFIK